MRHLAMTGIETTFMISAITSMRAMRATPPSLRMSEGTRSSAMTAQAPASSAIFACSGVVTSMMTPPLSISARPVLRRRPVSAEDSGSFARFSLNVVLPLARGGRWIADAGRGADSSAGAAAPATPGMVGGISGSLLQNRKAPLHEGQLPALARVAVELRLERGGLLVLLLGALGDVDAVVAHHPVRGGRRRGPRERDEQRARREDGDEGQGTKAAHGMSPAGLARRRGALRPERPACRRQARERKRGGPDTSCPSAAARRVDSRVPPKVRRPDVRRRLRRRPERPLRAPPHRQGGRLLDGLHGPVARRRRGARR